MLTRDVVGIYDVSRRPSGLSRYVESLLKGIDRSRYEVILFCREGGPYRRDGSFQTVFVCDRKDETIESNNSPGAFCQGDTKAHRPAVSVPGPRQLWRHVPAPVKLWAGFLRDARRLSVIIRRHPVSIFHAILVGRDASTVAARLAGVPNVVGTLQIDTTESLPRHWPLEFATNRALDRAIAVSESTRLDWIRRSRLRERDVITIPNSIDPSRFRRRTSQGEARHRLGLPAGNYPIVCGVGRLHPQKRFSDLVEAIFLLSKTRPDVMLVLAGEGPLRAELEQLAEERGIAMRVHFTGLLDDVQPVYDAADIFALSSRWEGLPFVLLEAMAAGLPAVATRVSGVPEVVSHGETGLLIPPESPGALATALGTLLDSPPLRRSMGSAGALRVSQQYNEREMLRRTIDIYEELLANGGNRARWPEAADVTVAPQSSPLIAHSSEYGSIPGQT